jgi:predicted S18 family serine protease
LSTPSTTTRTTTAESKSKAPPPPFLLEVSKAFQEIKNNLLQQVRQHSVASSENDNLSDKSSNNNHNDNREQQELYFHNLFLFQFQEKFLFHIMNHRIHQDPHDHREQELLKEQQENGLSEEHINTINEFIEQLFRSK